MKPYSNELVNIIYFVGTRYHTRFKLNDYFFNIHTVQHVVRIIVFEYLYLKIL